MASSARPRTRLGGSMTTPRSWRRVSEAPGGAGLPGRIDRRGRARRSAFGQPVRHVRARDGPGSPRGNGESGRDRRQLAGRHSQHLPPPDGRTVRAPSACRRRSAGSSPPTRTSRGRPTALWVKRYDFHATQTDDVLYVASEVGWREALSRFAERGIPFVIAQEHVAGDLVKFYGVRNGVGDQDANWFQWFYHRDKGMMGHSFDAARLRQGRTRRGRRARAGSLRRRRGHQGRTASR